MLRSFQLPKPQGHCLPTKSALPIQVPPVPSISSSVFFGKPNFSTQRVASPAATNRATMRNRVSATAAPPIIEVEPDSVKIVSKADQIMPGLIEFLKGDLEHLFDDKGIDQSKYDDAVEFVDPITRYSSLRGYLLNIKFLKLVFAPNFILHDIKRTGEWEVTTRWTMEMQLTVTRWLGPVRRLWDPKLVFTGTSIMGVNPETGKFNKHVDFWDAIDSQDYFSIEGFIHVLSQMSDLKRTPDLKSPTFKVLKKQKEYEIRRYNPYLVAETSMQGSASRDAGAQASTSAGGSSAAGSSSANPVASGPGNQAFFNLAGYIFGGNERSEKMEMTTPVFSDSTGKMQFVMEDKFKDVSALPKPNSPERVSLKEVPAGVYAASTFSGFATETDVKEELRKLRAALSKSGVETEGDDWVVARYNEPFTNPFMRRNEVLVPVKNFDLWA